jgi:hypothetical protein
MLKEVYSENFCEFFLSLIVCCPSVLLTILSTNPLGMRIQIHCKERQWLSPSGDRTTLKFKKSSSPELLVQFIIKLDAYISQV